jgi:hypothetical protein
VYLPDLGLIFVFDFQIFFIFDGENSTFLKLFASKGHYERSDKRRSSGRKTLTGGRASFSKVKRLLLRFNTLLKKHSSYAPVKNRPQDH